MAGDAPGISSKDTHALRLTSELVDLRAEYANRILLRYACRTRSRSESSSSGQPRIKKHSPWKRAKTIKNQSPEALASEYPGIPCLLRKRKISTNFALKASFQISVWGMRTGFCFATLAERAREARVAAPDNPVKIKLPLQSLQRLIKNQSPEALASGLSGAATRIRTGDLILTQDVLYQLSHSSIPQGDFLVTQIIISNNFAFVNTFSKNIFENFKIIEKTY